jgi:hypothetical protein
MFCGTLELSVLADEPVRERLVLEAVAQRLHQRAVVLAPERQDRNRGHRRHEREDVVRGAALYHVAQDDRRERRDDEPVERRHVDAGQEDPSGHHAKQQHHEERLVRGRLRHEEEEARRAPQAARDQRARRPVLRPAVDVARLDRRGPEPQIEGDPPDLVGGHAQHPTD